MRTTSTRIIGGFHEQNNFHMVAPGRTSQSRQLDKAELLHRIKTWHLIRKEKRPRLDERLCTSIAGMLEQVDSVIRWPT